MPITPPYYPIVYVRGYAATMAEIEETVATPYMGFNLGSTKLRQSYAGEVVRFIFESPLIRLMKDEGYVDAYRGGDLPPEGERVPAKSVWIFRYYERVSEELGEGERVEIEDFAADLRRFLLRVQDHVCGADEAERAKFRVHLVAHSMGGLVCRCYLQNFCRYEGGKKRSAPLDPLVDKVFTYATPHNGIEMQGFNVPDLGALDRLQVRNFNRGRMREYLRLGPGSDDVSSLDGAFPPERFFCLAGTNHRDYQAFHGLSRRGTGPTSDGLVMMKNAVVRDAPRAHVHRSHSGHYGIVNSEEGYQNLRRFLFGEVRIDALLRAEEITLPAAVQRKKDGGAKIHAQYNIDVAARVRNAGCFLSERRVSQESAVRRRYEDLVEAGKPAYLFTGYLYSGNPEGPGTRGADVRDTALAFAIEIAIEVPVFEVDGRFWFDEHYEGARLYAETITFHVRRTAAGFSIRYGLSSEAGPGNAGRVPAVARAGAGGRLEIEIPVGFRPGAARPPRPGFRGTLVVAASPWNA
ncbi:MAG: hypothetical protein AB1726_08120 [Planctomycetota bacterium]